ncbi:MAG: D-aminoacylase [Rhodospirillaceae bacterium]|nr:D-aminoacylase [Rhodospirillaceae bacterium]
MKMMVSAFAAFLLAGPAQAADTKWDLLIAGGTVIDGTGKAGFRADVAIDDGKIVRVSPTALPKTNAVRIIDASGKAVAPGFIDLHLHMDPVALPSGENLVRQGVTTALGGPDGSSPWPLADYLEKADALNLGMNVAYLTGHNSIREAVMGLDNRAPTAAELDEMKARVAQGMRDGAFGLSTGLRYTPGVYSEIGEVIELSKVAAGMGGIYTSHLRDEGAKLLEGVGEAIEIGRKAKIPVVLTHHKAVGSPNWGASVKTLAMVEAARKEGVDVMIDQYPYTASHTNIDILVPPEALAGGDKAFLARVDDRKQGEGIMEGIVWNIMNDRGAGDIGNIQFSIVPWDKSLEGKTLKDWAVREGLSPTPENGARLAIEVIRRGNAGAIFHAINEEDVQRIMKYPFTAIATDGRVGKLGEGSPHPRSYGTFPRVLGRYVRELKVLTLEDAVRKMSSLPADRLGLKDRGRLAAGAWADVVVFDPATVTDKATYQNPHQYPDGIPYVIVNGVPVVDNGKWNDAGPGQVLKRPGAKS